MRTWLIGVWLWLLSATQTFGQGLNHNYLIGYTGIQPPWTFYERGIIKIDSINFNIFGLSRKMKFLSSQANIANDTGAILFYTNGCWIANALEDTMLNGSGLSPDLQTTQWCNIAGITSIQSSVILPFPGDTSKYVLFHHSGSQVEPYSYPLVCYYSVIDINLDNGLGGVIQKNQILIQDKLNRGFAACKHANGRDWWVVILRDSSDIAYKILLNDQGIANISIQSLGTSAHTKNEAQKYFSPDGKKFAFRYFSGSIGNISDEVRVFDFDRCSGTFSNPRIVSWSSQYGSLGLAFSANSKYLYTVSDFDTIYQINTDTANLQASMTMVAINDGFISPYPPHQTDFWTMYLAANGKIVISSGSSVVDLHYINYPDSAGLACDVQQHALHMPCWTGQSHVNHPNYYLGCDTTLGCTPCYTNVDELSPPDLKFRVYPNPVSDGLLNIGYLLPQNKHGIFEMYDITGKVVFRYTLPPWSNYQSFKLPPLSDGIYQCVITSDGKRVSKKVAIVKE